MLVNIFIWFIKYLWKEVFVQKTVFYTVDLLVWPVQPIPTASWSTSQVKHHMAQITFALRFIHIIETLKLFKIPPTFYPISSISIIWRIKGKRFEEKQSYQRGCMISPTVNAFPKANHKSWYLVFQDLSGLLKGTSHRTE